MMPIFAYGNDKLLSDEEILKICQKQEDFFSNIKYEDSTYFEGNREEFISAYRFVEKVKKYSFDDFFSKKLQESIINTEINCFPYNWQYYNHDSVWFSAIGRHAIKNIYGIRKFATDTSHLPTGWVFQGKIIFPQCFVTQWESGDNYEHYNKEFSAGVNDNDIGAIFGNTLKNIEPIPSSWSKNEQLYLAADIQDCFDRKLYNGIKYSEPLDIKFVNDTGYPEDFKEQYGYNNHIVAVKSCDNKACYRDYHQGYTVMGKLPLDICQSLAPSFPGKCVDAAAIFRVEYINSFYHYSHLAGIFEYKDKFMLVPLKIIGYSNQINTILNYLNSLKED